MKSWEVFNDEHARGTTVMQNYCSSILVAEKTGEKKKQKKNK